MKGKINDLGNLYIERAGKLKLQGCACSGEDSCGDWCSLFGEPTISKWMGSPDPKEENRELNPKHWDLKICRTIIYFDELIDERNGSVDNTGEEETNV